MIEETHLLPVLGWQAVSSQNHGISSGGNMSDVDQTLSQTAHLQNRLHF